MAGFDNRQARVLQSFHLRSFGPRFVERLRAVIEESGLNTHDELRIVLAEDNQHLTIEGRPSGEREST